MCVCVRRPLTDNVHLAEVQADFGESGDTGGGVVPPTVTVLSPGAVGGTLCGVIEPAKHTDAISPVTVVKILPTAVLFTMKRTKRSFFFFFILLPEAEDLRKILPFSRRQGDVLLWSLCLHSCAVDLREEKKKGQKEA